MTEDPTEFIRRIVSEEINSDKSERAELEKVHGQVWDTDQLKDDFEVEGFLAPLVIAKDKKTGGTGTLMFQHNPRFYWGWTENTENE